MKNYVRQIAVLVLAIGQIVAGATVGERIAEVSDTYPNYVVPAGYAFTIWGLIFLLALAFAVYQLLPAQRENFLQRRIGWWAASAFLANSVWMTVFPRGFLTLSVAVIFWILLSLVAVIIEIYRNNEPPNLLKTISVETTFSIFLGWITVAAVVNVTLVLVAREWNGAPLNRLIWGVLMLLVTGVLATTLTVLLRGNAAFALTVVWALIGVAVNQITESVATNARQTILAAVMMSLLVTGTLGLVKLKNWHESLK